MAERFEVSIPQWENIGKVHTKSPEYTLYTIHVIHRPRPPLGPKEWVIKKRFSDCYDVYKRLEMALGEDAPMPEFPPRTLTSFGNFDPEFVERRRRLLERFFTSLPPFAWTKPCLREFLGVDNAEVAKNARAIANRTLLLQPALSDAIPGDIPAMMTLESTNEEVFLHLLIDSARECIASMQTLHDALHSISGLEERISLLHSRLEERKLNLHTLESLRLELSRWLCDIKVQHEEKVFLFLTHISDIIDRALEWDKNLEQEMLVESNADFSTLSNEDRIRQYHKDAEDLITESLSGHTAPAEIATRARAFLAKLDQDISVYTIRKQMGVVSKVTAIKDYLLSNRAALYFDSSSSMSRMLNPAAEVDRFEQKVFHILDSVGKIQQGSAPDVRLAIAETRKEIDSLTREMRSFRSELQSKHEDESRFAFLNRIEDLQENLADLEFNFRGVEERADSAINKQTVSKARKTHHRLEDSMFQL